MRSRLVADGSGVEEVGLQLTEGGIWYGTGGIVSKQEIRFEVGNGGDEREERAH
jgi:hypothetical protein